jgi:putative DNA primase/helicase
MTAASAISAPVHLLADDEPAAPSTVATGVPAVKKTVAPAPQPAENPMSEAGAAAERSRLKNLIESSVDARCPETDPGLKRLRELLAKLGPEPNPPMEEAALSLVQTRKWQIFPLHTPNPKDRLCTCGTPGCTDQGKHPRTANGFHDSSSSPDQIRQWWNRWSNANIGIPTGVQNHICVLDVDPRHNGDKSLKNLELKYGKLPSTFTVRTGGGGFHFYFSRWTGPKIKSVSNALGDEYPGLDVKGEGGYTVGPGSLHLSGNRYEIINGGALVDVPEWLETLLVNPPGINGSNSSSFKAPEIINEGTRDTTLTAMATALANKNIGDVAVLAALREVNRTRCNPPYDDSKIVDIVRRQCDFVRKNPAVNPTRVTPSMTETAAHTKAAAQNEPKLADYGSCSGLTEVAAADRFVEKIAGECVFNISINKWHVWTGRVWKVDERNSIKNRCRNFVKSLYADLSGIGGKHDRNEYLSDVEKLNTRRGIDNIVALSAIQLTKRSEDFDSNPHILNLQNGSIEFTPDGINFREHRKEDMCSFIGGCEYHPEEPIPDIWSSHVHKVASEDPELATTVQTVFGYCLEGGNPLEKVVITYGSGRNGKSVTLRTFSRIFGKYAVSVAPNTLMESGNKTTSPERLKMRNARLIVAQEPNKQSVTQHQKDTSVLDSGFIKSASGKDTISARSLYSNTVEEFAVSGVVTISTNPLPTVNDRSVAFWDRLILIPFDFYFREEDRDPLIEEKFSQVLPGILNWLVQGWEIYRKTNTIMLCDTVKSVLAEYRCIDDEYAPFITDCIEERKNAETSARDLYNEYTSWSKSRCHSVKSQQTFGNDMAARFSKKRKKTGVTYSNIRIRTGQQQMGT